MRSACWIYVIDITSVVDPWHFGTDPDADPYLCLMDPDADPGGLKSYGSHGSGTLVKSHKEVTKQEKSRFFFQVLLDNGRIWMRIGSTTLDITNKRSVSPWWEQCNLSNRNHKNKRSVNAWWDQHAGIWVLDIIILVLQTSDETDGGGGGVGGIRFSGSKIGCVFVGKLCIHSNASLALLASDF